MAAVTIPRDIFMQMTPNIFRFYPFPLLTEISIIGFDKNPKHPTGITHISWNNTMVPLVIIEIDGKQIHVVRPLITNCVQMRKGIIHNPNNIDLRCVDYFDNTLHDDLVNLFPQEKYPLPEKFICIEKIKRGIAVERVKWENAYSPEFFAGLNVDENGFTETVPDTFEKYVQASDGFIPHLFSKDGIPRKQLFTYIIEPIK